MHIRGRDLSILTLCLLIRMDLACMFYTVLIIYSMTLPHMLTLRNLMPSHTLIKPSAGPLVKVLSGSPQSIGAFRRRHGLFIATLHVSTDVTVAVFAQHLP